MPRDTTAQQDTDLAALAYDVHTIVEVQNADGTWIELTDDPVNGLDWLIQGEVEEDVDRPVLQATLQLRRDREGTSSLSPTREDSPLNVDDVAAYAPLIDAGRGMRISTAVVGAGVATIPADFQQIFLGTIDSFDAGKDPMKVVARDAIGAELATAFVEARTSFGSVTGRAIELVMQDILDVYAPAVTLLVPSVPGFNITPYTADGVSVHRALQTLAAKIGYVVRVRWDDGVSDWRLVLEEPDRTQTVPDWTFAASQYFDITRFAINRLPVRNYIELQKAGVVLAFAEDTASQARFKRQYLRITEPDDSPIDTAGEAQAMVDAALADLSDPDAHQDVDARLFWPIQVRDLVRFSANGVQYNVDQDLAVFGYRHVLTKGSGQTFLRVRGKPAGMYRYWLQIHNNQELEDATKRETIYSDSQPHFHMVRGVDGSNNPGFFLDVHYDLGPDAASYYITAAYDDGSPQSSDEHIIAGVSGEKGRVRITSGAGSPQFFLDSHTVVEVSFTPKAAKIVLVSGEPPIGGKRSTFRPIANTEDEGDVGARVTVTSSGTVHATDLLQFSASDFTVATVAGRPEVRAIAAGASLGSLTDVTLTAEGSGDYLRHNGAVWVNVTGVAVADLVGTVAVTQGGTGVSNPTLGNLLVGAGSSAMTQLTFGTAGGYVRSNGVGWVRNQGVLVSDLTSWPGTGFVAVSTGTTSTGTVDSGASGGFLRSNGTTWTRDTIAPGDLPTHTHSAGDITTGQLDVARGGTGLGTLTGVGRLIVSADATTFILLDSGAAGGFVRSDGSTWARNTIQAGDLPAHTHTAAQISGGTFAGTFEFTAQLDLRHASDVMLRLQHTSATGNPMVGFYQSTTTERARIIFLDTQDEFRLNVNAATGRITLRTNNVERLRVHGSDADEGDIRVVNSQFGIAEQSAEVTGTLNWDLGNSAWRDNDGTTTQDIGVASMIQGHHYRLTIRDDTGSVASWTWTDVDVWINGLEPVFPQVNGEITVVDLWCSNVGGTKTVIAAWGPYS